MAGDTYCYPGTSILINTLDICDAKALRRIERTLTQLRSAEALAYANRSRQLNQRTLRGLHRILFQDLYVWAGTHRTIELTKVTTSFARVATLATHADIHIPPAFRNAAAAASSQAELAAALASCWGELNLPHPFREGNGRATQIFITALANRAGFDIDWSNISRGDERAAAIASSRGDFQPYQDLLDRALVPVPPNRALLRPAKPLTPRR